MNTTSIEDILIDNSSNKKNNKKGKGCFTFFIFILLVGILAVVGYMYFSKPTVTNKELFTEALNNVKILDVIDDTKMCNLMDNIEKSDTEIDSNIQYTNSIEKDEIENIDFSSFNVNLNNKRMVQSNKDYTEIAISYLGNEAFRPIKILRDNDKYAIAQEEIVNMYVGYTKEEVEKNIEENPKLKQLKELVDCLKLDSTNLKPEEKNKIKEKYLSKFMESVNEENITIQDNYALDNGVNVIEYTLKLNQDEYKTATINFLKELKNDDELLKKFLIESKTKIETLTPEETNKPNSPEVENDVETETVQPEENSESENVESESNEVQNNENENNEENAEVNTETNNEENSEESNTETETVRGETENLNTEQTVMEAKPMADPNEMVGEEAEEPQEQEESKVVEAKPIVSTEGETKPITKANVIPKKEFLAKLLFSRKLSKSTDDIKASIDEIIEEVSNSQGKGIEFKIYKSQDGVEKVNFVLPNESYFDFVFNPKLIEQKNMKMTYIYSGDNNIFKVDDSNIITAEDELDNESKTEVNKDTESSNGFSIEILRTQKDSLSDSKLTYSWIENQVINKKMIIESKLQGNVNSRKIKNNLLINYSTNEGESKLLIDSVIYLRKIDYLEDITESNTLFINSLPQNEIEATNQAIKDKIKLVYDEKQSQFNFINSNIKNPENILNPEDVSNEISKEDAKNLVQEAINNKRAECEENEEEFTLEHLKDLGVEGYELKVTTAEDKAVIILDVYTFIVDSEFNLIEEG